MRERLVAGFVLFAVFVVLSSGIVRVYSLVGMIKTYEAAELDRSVALMSALIDERAAAGEETTATQLRSFLGTAEHLDYVDASGSRSHTSSPLYESEPSRFDLRSSADVPTGGTLTLKRSGVAVDQRIADAVLPIIELTLVLILAAIVVGYVLAVRLSRPFRALAGVADDIGAGKFDTGIPSFSIREANVVSKSLQASATRLKEMVRAESEFASNASHQLRTPIAALHLVLEDLASWPETSPEVAAELRRSVYELDRVSSAVTSLLDMARRKDAPAAETAVDFSTVLAETARRWRPQATAAGRELTVHAPGPCLAAVSSSAVTQILDVLIENSLEHGVGRIRLLATEEGQYLALRVADEGTGPIDESAFRRRARGASSDGEGIGLALAVELAAYIGAELTLGDGPTVSFVLTLPKVAQAAEPGTRSLELSTQGE